MTTDWEWLSFILTMDIGLFVICPLLPGIGGSVSTGAVDANITFNILTFALGLFTFGLTGVTGIAMTAISAFFFVINGMGIYLIAKMVRGN